MTTTDAPQPPNYEHGICDCPLRPRQLQFPFCGTCGHPSERHYEGAGCADGVDHPGSVGPMPSELPFTGAHGPSAEQFARGIAVLAMNLQRSPGDPTPEERNREYAAAVAYILTGETGS